MLPNPRNPGTSHNNELMPDADNHWTSNIVFKQAIQHYGYVTKSKKSKNVIEQPS